MGSRCSSDSPIPRHSYILTWVYNDYIREQWFTNMLFEFPFWQKMRADYYLIPASMSLSSLGWKYSVLPVGPNTWAALWRRQCLQVGQEEWEMNHLSTHSMWKLCLQLGKTLTLSPFMKSVKQIGHSMPWISGLSLLYTMNGSDFMDFFFNPLFAKLAAICLACEDLQK